MSDKESMSGEAVGPYAPEPDPWGAGPFDGRYGDSPPEDALVGLTVSAIHVDPTDYSDAWGHSGNQNLYLTTEDGVWQLATEGDCCSETWWADIYSPQQVVGGTITEVRDIPLMAPMDERGRQEVDAAYGIGIRTTRGEGKFVYRNSSNGYYGGSCALLRTDAIPPTAIEITEDWSA